MPDDKNVAPGRGGPALPGSAEEQAEHKVRESMAAAMKAAQRTDDEIMRAYCEQQRQIARESVQAGMRFLAQAQADRDYVATYGTDEG